MGFVAGNGTFDGTASLPEAGDGVDAVAGVGELTSMGNSRARNATPFSRALSPQTNQVTAIVVNMMQWLCEGRVSVVASQAQARTPAVITHCMEGVCFKLSTVTKIFLAGMVHLDM